jgi:GNAT superfamily N-acetyltransferase
VSSASLKDMKTVAAQRELLAESQRQVLIGTKQQRLAQALACAPERIVVARGAAQPSGVQGHAQWEPCPQRNRAELTALFVDVQHRRKGVGSALLAAVEGQALASGFAFIQVKLALTLVEASVFFQCSGFALVRNDPDGTLTYEKSLR